MKRSIEILAVALGAVTGAILADSACKLFLAGSLLLDLAEGIAVTVGFALGVVAGWRARHGLNRHVQQVLQTATSRTKALYIASLVVAVGSFAVTCANLAQHAHDMPSDEQLIANFTRNRATFDQLAAMVQEDQQKFTVDTNWYLDGSSGISAERMALYDQRLHQTNIRYGAQYRTIRHSMEFSYWRIGSGVFSTKTKGYWYSKTPPATLVPTLDKPKARLAYRHITGNWYLFYEHFTD